MRCPDLKNPETRRNFNRVAQALGGRALGEQDVSPRQPYIASLTPEQLRGYHLAHYYWNQSANPGAAFQYAMDVMNARDALEGIGVATDESRSTGLRQRAGKYEARAPASAAAAPEGPLLTSPTEAELKAKAEAIAKAEAEAAKSPPAKNVTVDQTDLFNPQGSLFQGRPGYTVRPSTVAVMRRAVELVGEKAFQERVELHLTELFGAQEDTDFALSPEERAAEIEGVARIILEEHGEQGFGRTEVDRAADDAKGHKASEAQQAAGNYPKGHVLLGPDNATMSAALETAAGESRRPEWPKLADHYGYFKGTVGFDKDHLDFFIAPGTPATLATIEGTPRRVYVVNQTKAENGKGGFDEHKVLLGVPPLIDEAGLARDMYTRNYEPGWSRYSSITPITWAGFRKWATDHSQRGPKGGELTLSAAQQFDAEAANEVPGTASRADRDEGYAPTQRDLFAAPALPGTPAKNLETYVVEAQAVRTIRLPKTRITDAVSAAFMFKQLTSSPRERFQMIGLDERGKPLAFYDLFAGTLAATSVYPREVWTVLHQTPGVKGVWFAHNHPGGNAHPSKEDIQLTRDLQKGLGAPQGIQYKGHLIIAGDQFYDIDTHDRLPLPDIEGMQTVELPVIERVIKQNGVPGPEVKSPEQAREYLAELAPKEAGLLLLNYQHRAIGWWPMAVKDMQNATWGEDSRRVIQMIGRNNPGAAVVYAPAGTNLEDLQRGLRELGEMLQWADVTVLDAMLDQGRPDSTGKSTLMSLAEKNLMTTPISMNRQQSVASPEGSYQLGEQPTAGIHPNAVAWEVKAHPVARALGDKLHVVRHALHLPARAVEQLLKTGSLRLAKGYTDAASGEVYLVAGNLRKGEALQTLLHEAVGHAGIFNILPEEAGKPFVDAMLDIYRSRAGVIRTQVNAGFLQPYAFDLRNRAHQAQAAMEYVAHSAERGEEQGLWQKLVAAIRAALRRMGFVKEWTENDIQGLLRRSRESLENMGEDTFNGLPAWQLGERGPLWYSALERAVDGLKMGKASPQQWLATIKARPGVKADEILWSGLEDWLGAQQGPVAKDDVLAFLRDNGVQVSETLLGGVDAGDNAMQALIRERDNIVVAFDAVGLEVEWDPEGHFSYLHQRSTRGDMFFFPEDNEALREPAEPLNDLAEEWQKWAAEHGFSDMSADDAALILSRQPRPYNARVALENEYIQRFMKRWDRAQTADSIHDINTLPAEFVEQARRLREIAPTTAEFNDSNIGNSRYSNWKLPGGEHYRELLITLPIGQGEIGGRLGEAAFTSSHFDEANILAHVRFDERKDADGKRVLFIEEIQSDFGEALRDMEKEINKTVDRDFEKIVGLMERAGVVKVDCD